MTTALSLVSEHDEAAGCFHGMIGRHPLMLELFEAIRRAAGLKAPVVIEGPTGVGKDLVAQALHMLSGAPGRLVCVNVTALPETLVESELFGSLRGAFTGATGDREGVVSASANGTLFLDEAGDLPTAVQAKLLRTVETGLFRPVGAAVERRASFRLVVAVQETPRSLLVGKHWRADFYYRVAGVTLRVPRLAERQADVPLLIHHFLARLGLGPLGKSGIAFLSRYDWPGNVRQLQRAVERAAFGIGPGRLDADAILEAAMELDPDSGRVEDLPQPTTLREQERQQIVSALRQARSTREAATTLGISLHQLYRRLKVHGIRPPRTR